MDDTGVWFMDDDGSLDYMNAVSWLLWMANLSSLMSWRQISSSLDGGFVFRLSKEQKSKKQTKTMDSVMSIAFLVVLFRRA